MCNAQVFMPEAALKQKVFDSKPFVRAQQWMTNKTGWAGDIAEIDSRLAAKISGGEWHGDRIAREMGEEAQEATRLSKTYHGQSVHAQNISRSKAPTPVRPIAGRTNNA